LAGTWLKKTHNLIDQFGVLGLCLFFFSIIKNFNKKKTLFLISDELTNSSCDEKNASHILSGKEKHCSMDYVMISHQHYLWFYKMNSLAIAGIQVQNTIIKNTNFDIKLQ
jgi:hypothetical protein